MSTISRCPWPTRRRMSARTAAAERLRVRAADERDHAEGAGKTAPVLDLDEGANAVEAVVGLDAADRADVAGDRRRRLLAPPGDDEDVRGQPGEGGLPEVRPAAGDVHAPVAPRGARCRLPGLRDGLVRHAARVHDGELGALRHLLMPVCEQPLAYRLEVRERHLAAEKARREARHRVKSLVRRGNGSAVDSPGHEDVRCPSVEREPP